MIIALAGRRIDAADTTADRFPLSQAESVKRRLKDLFINLKPKALVCSAACGADLLALQVAGELKIPRSIVLPFDRALFKTTSVTDRPGDWDGLYDRVLEQTANEEKVSVLNYSPDDDETYRRANIDILEKAINLGEKYATKDFTAVVVWEGQSKGEDDTTEHFKNESKKRGFRIEQILSK